MKNLYLMPLCIFIFSMAFAQESSFDFKGIALGSPVSMIESDSRFTCKDSEGILADQSCMLKYNESETIAGAPIKTFILSYYKGNLESMRISFLEKHFTGVISALTEKYGGKEPKTETVRNRMGTSFENRIYVWKRKGATLDATRYASDLDTSSVTFRTDYALEEFARRKKAADKKKAGDL